MLNKNLRTIMLALVAVLAVSAIWYGLTRQNAILVEDASAILDAEDRWRVTLTIHNQGDPDWLIGVSAADGINAEFIAAEDPKGLPIPGQSSPSLALDGAHIVASGDALTTQAGQLASFSLHFENAGEVRIKPRLLEGRMPVEEDTIQSLIEPEPTSVMIQAVPHESGLTLKTKLQNFRFAPELLGLPHMPGEGHGHLYIGGLKVMRVLYEEVEVGALPPGRHRLRLTLNTNDHRTCLIGGEPVQDEIEIEIS